MDKNDLNLIKKLLKYITFYCHWNAIPPPNTMRELGDLCATVIDNDDDLFKPDILKVVNLLVEKHDKSIEFLKRFKQRKTTKTVQIGIG